MPRERLGRKDSRPALVRTLPMLTDMNTSHLPLLLLPFVLCISANFACGEENHGEKLPSVDINLAIYPSHIQYGDAIFAFVEVKNSTSEALVMPSRLGYPGHPFLDTVIRLKLVDNVIYEWKDARSITVLESNLYPPGLLPSFLYKAEDYQPLNCKPNESYMIGSRVLWCPQYEFSDHSVVQINFDRFFDIGTEIIPRIKIDELKKAIQDRNGFVVSANVTIFGLDTLNPDKNNQFRYFPNSTGTIDIIQPKNIALKIGTRSSDTTELLARWFLELPSTVQRPDCSREWTIDAVFASPLYVSGSPYNVNTSSGNELGPKRHRARDDYKAFYSTMESRTPEVEARIKRTNEYADKLLKLPASEVSPHMKEFITLRGLLVDLRYADETGAARDKAFEKIVDWLKTSKYKTLWVCVLKECGLPSIYNGKHFPISVVEGYVNKLVETFPKEANASIADLDKEQSANK